MKRMIPVDRPVALGDQRAAAIRIIGIVQCGQGLRHGKVQIRPAMDQRIAEQRILVVFKRESVMFMRAELCPFAASH